MYFSATKRETGFTLIELLVVISIISLLSSVVLASLRTAREKATIAAGQIAERAVLTELADSNQIIEWRFERATCTGGCANGNAITTLVNSGEAGSGTNLSGLQGTPTYSTDAPIKGYGSGFFNLTDRIYSNSSSIPTSLQAVTGLTISFWMKTNATALTEIYTDPAYGLSFDSGLIRLRYWAYSGSIPLCSAPFPSDSKWHHVIATFGGGIASQMYVDGKAVGVSCNSTTITTYSPAYIYTMPGGGPSGSNEVYLSRYTVFNGRFK